jgi:hypothetical protein
MHNYFCLGFFSRHWSKVAVGVTFNMIQAVLVTMYIFQGIFLPTPRKKKRTTV